MTLQVARPTVEDRTAFEQVFTRARGAELVTANGRVYIDFSCGTLNYGHNNPHVKRRLIEFVNADGLANGHDHHVVAKREFIGRLRDIVLGPRELSYQVRFCGPSGAVDAARTLARMATGRRRIVSFDSIGDLERILAGPDVPAAVIVEPVRIEDGIHPASPEWLRRLRKLTEQHGILLICDESQTGCGRTGPFFGFEHAAVVPDIVTLSSSLSGYGLPLSAVLFRPELDLWAPGEHTSGNHLAFVTGAAALELWRQTHFHTTHAVAMRRLDLFARKLRLLDPDLAVRGRGMVLGIDTGHAARAARVQRSCFDNGLIVELCGRADQVVKVMPPLTIDPARHDRGLEILQHALLLSGVDGDEA